MTGRTRHAFHDKEGQIGQRSLPEVEALQTRKGQLWESLGTCFYELLEYIASQNHNLIAKVGPCSIAFAQGFANGSPLILSPLPLKLLYW